MGFDDWYRLSAHAVITDARSRVLLVQATYGDRAWGLPGGAVDPGETLHDALLRECREELGCPVQIRYLSGIYYHSAIQAHAAIFRCDLVPGEVPRLSAEHSQYRYVELGELTSVQRKRVDDCLRFDGTVQSERF
jgi:8-oxo-dGTP pyrophosphatase MutT (NUDIX family)